MFSNIKSSEQSTPETKKSHKGRRAAVALVAGIALLKGAQFEADQAQKLKSVQQELADKEHSLDRVTDFVADQAGVGKGVVTGESLHLVNSLPGIEKLVSPEQRQLLEASTVKIAKRVKDSNSEWFESCTATKVTNGSESFILSAAHCFSSDMASSGGKGAVPDVLNMTELSSYEYAVFLPSKEPGLATGEPIARSSRLVIDFSGRADLALMRVDTSADFDDIPAISLEDFTSVNKSPNLGEQVALYGVPGSSGNVPITATGTYFGRVTGGALGSPNQFIDLVGIDPSLPAEDACNYGASGSSAVFADGSVTGALTIRNNIGYETGMKQPEDIHSSQYRLMIESLTGLDLGEFTTICGFAVPDEQSFAVLQSALNGSMSSYQYSK